ncbi:putative hydro-lyase [Parvibium lacunae]|uniref:Putative hydro-lyase DU000_09335 n=1 Tax=Parvibium lacunae TaxID=1888893 RepID=A0A368L0C0_9BURK|nr:putative hydro-lyase [Parvibium lacunae]RCS56999.1 putative hydro-lyase [Parvibium lacunae]
MSAQAITTDSLGYLARQSIRQGHHRSATSNLAPGYVQANLAILPASLATDFLRFCQQNPKPCPLLAVSSAGDISLPSIAKNLDIRTDVPRYVLWRNGEAMGDLEDLRTVWREDLVTFAIGCSFSFEQALLSARVPVRNIEQNHNVSMYITNIPTQAAGPFSGPMVVSMRPMKAADAIKAIQITSRYPSVHGAPIHFGDPSEIGIKDLDRPDYGDPTEIRSGEVPVFWACGVTPQSAIRSAKPEISITHKPGYMLVTDLLNVELEFR